MGILLRGRAKEAERALEGACIKRFGTLRPTGKSPVIRIDNGLIFQSRSFRSACRDYRLSQEFVTPYTPEQYGIIERFFRSLKRSACGNTTSRVLPKRSAQSLIGLSGTTQGDRISL
jgi:putative transposase